MNIQLILETGIKETTTLFLNPEFNKFINFNFLLGIALQVWFFPPSILNNIGLKEHQIDVQAYFIFLKNVKNNPVYSNGLNRINLKTSIRFYRKKLTVFDRKMFQRIYFVDKMELIYIYILNRKYIFDRIKVFYIPLKIKLLSSVFMLLSGLILPNINGLLPFYFLFIIYFFLIERSSFLISWLEKNVLTRLISQLATRFL